MLQSSCKLINNLIQSPPPPASFFMPQQCAELLLFFTHLLCKVCKFLGFAIQMWPSHRTHLFHRDINSSGYSQLKPAGNKAGCIRLCFRNTEANQIVHPPPVSRAAPACQKPHYSSMPVEEKGMMEYAVSTKGYAAVLLFLFYMTLPCLPDFTKCNE